MTAKKFKKRLKGDVSFPSVEKTIYKQFGYRVIFFHTPEGDMEIQRYGLSKKAEHTPAFTYSKNAQLIFINANAPAKDKLYLLLHEAGHIALGHIGDGKLITRSPIEIDVEADHFAYTVLRHKNRSPYLAALVFIFFMAILGLLFMLFHTPTESVYVTPNGQKYHRSSCITIQGKKAFAIDRDTAQKLYDPCMICNP